MFRHVPQIFPALVFLLALSVGSAGADPYVEDFTSTAYKDPVNTTADWNTAAGELKLPPFELSLLGAYDTPGLARGVAISGDLAFVADHASGLQVIDISDPETPALLGAYDTPAQARAVVVSGRLALVADYLSGLQVIDIADPSHPTLAGSLDTPGYAFGLDVSGDIAYVADGSPGLQVISIGDPSNPVLVGTCSALFYGYDVAVSGDRAYVADGSTGLKVLSVANPSSPLLIGSYNTPGLAQGVAVSGDRVLVADDSGGLLVFDVGVSSSPTLIGVCSGVGSAYKVAIEGDLAYVADGSNGLHVVDISDPGNPMIVDTYDTPNGVMDVAVEGDIAYIADYYGGLKGIRTSYPRIPEPVGACTASGAEFYDVAPAGDLVYVADNDYGLRVIDIQDPAAPLIVGSYETPGTATGLDMAGTLVFLANGIGGLTIVDVDQPTSPVLVGQCAVAGVSNDVDVAGDYAYVTDIVNGLEVIDISNPSSPSSVGSCSTPGTSWRVSVAGDHAFLADGPCDLQVIDISDPTNPVLVGSVSDPTGNAMDVAVSGSHAYVVNDALGLRVIDLEDPTNPVLIGSCPITTMAYSVAISGNRAFVGDGANRFHGIDISDPAYPVPIFTWSASGAVADIAVFGEFACLGNFTGGFQMVRVYQSEWDLARNVGRSLAVDGGDEEIVRVKLNSVETAGLAWDLSADGGAHWTPVASAGSWTRILQTGDDLLWRSTHTMLDVNPSVSQLSLDWMGADAPIAAIADVPGDQGGWLRLNFTRSGYDFTDEALVGLTGYGLYRRVDDPLKKDRILSAPALPDARPDALSDFAGGRVRRLDETYFVLGGDRADKDGGGFPEGVWEFISFHPALQQEAYCALVPAVADSTAEHGIRWSVFMTTAHTTTPTVWYASLPDSGYSTDDIAPSVPGGFNVAHQHPDGATLSWDACPDGDFRYFRVYRGASEGFEIGPESLVHETTGTGWIDVSGETGHAYRITALDQAGNESGPASPEAVSGIDLPRPEVVALHQNTPNPFNPSTTIRFDLPAAGDVRLRVFDLSGRLVATLLDGRVEAGRRSVVWRGENDAGRDAGSGLYVYRLETAGFSESRKMLLLQ